MTVAEFGVGQGAGLLKMEQYASQIELFTGVSVGVVGFDSGSGLPAFIGDYPDHLDQWHPGDYRMNHEQPLSKIDHNRTKIIIGDVSRTVPEFLENGEF